MKNSMIAKMRNTKLGRALARLVGEDAGAVMMEYVILAVLIAAAAVVAIAYFGRTVVGEANVATTAMATGGNAAEGVQGKVQKTANTGMAEAVKVNKSFSDAKEEAAK